MDSLVVSGSQPGPSSTYGTKSKGRPRSGYRRLAESGSADELLFKSFNAGQIEKSSFADPWEKPKNERKSRPLLWAPSPSPTGMDVKHFTNSLKKNRIQGQKTENTTPRNKYKLLKWTPTYVDETLFGPPLQEPSFQAPWSEKTPSMKPYLFSSTDFTKQSCSKEHSFSGDRTYLMDERPHSRLNQRTKSTLARPSTVNSFRPVWRP